MQALKSQIDEVERQLQTEYDRIRTASLSSFRAARAQEQMLKERLAAGKQQMLDLQGRSMRFSILKREVDTNREIYNGLLSRLKEIGVAGGVGINNISIVDKAQVPLYAYKPDFGKSVSMGLAIGLIIGLLVAWLLEHLDDTIRFADDVERETGAAVLGVVPKMKPLEPGKTRIALSPHLDPTSAFSEAYRSVRTALQFSTPQGAPRRLVVTSSSKHEGKSTTALALGHQLRADGQARPVGGRGPAQSRAAQAAADGQRARPVELPVGQRRRDGAHPPHRDPGPVRDDDGAASAQSGGAHREHQDAHHARAGGRAFAHGLVDGPPCSRYADDIVPTNQSRTPCSWSERREVAARASSTEGGTTPSRVVYGGGRPGSVGAIGPSRAAERARRSTRTTPHSACHRPQLPMCSDPPHLLEGREG
jgi:hypothetical protein